MSATQSTSNPGFGGAAPSAGARLSTQEVWQYIGDMAGQVGSLATLQSTLSASLLSTVMGPAPRAADMTDELQAKIENDDDIKIYIKDELEEAKWSAARDAIVGFVMESHTAFSNSLINSIDKYINENTTTNSLKSLLNENTKIISTLSPTLEALVRHREEEVSHGSDTARNTLERTCEETRARFRSAANSNSIHFKEIEKANKLKKEVKDRRDTLSTDLSIEALDRNEKEMEKLEKYYTIAEKREKAAKSALVEHYRKHYSNSKEEEKNVSYLVPKGIEKGKGSELAKTAPLWLKQHITSFPTIFRFVDRTCKEFDSEKAVFWKPPLLKDGLKDVPLIERDSYRQETKDLWDLLATGKLEADPFSKLTQPCMRGRYGNVSVEGEVDNGVLAIWVLLMRYRKCDDAHTTHLIKTLSQSENLFRAPKSNIQKSVDSLGKVLKECVTLGVKVPWVTTGREVVKVLKTQGFTEYVHKFMNGGPDPEDSAKHFQRLLSTVERVAKDVEETENKKGSNRKSYWAHEAHLYDLNYDASINSHCITTSPNPNYDPTTSENDVTENYSAYDTNSVAASNWDEQYDYNGQNDGNSEEFYDCYDGAADNVWDENFSDYGDFQAFESVGEQG